MESEHSLRASEQVLSGFITIVFSQDKDSFSSHRRSDQNISAVLFTAEHKGQRKNICVFKDKMVIAAQSEINIIC